MVYDIAIIGAGVSGAGIAYELSKYKLDVAIIDKYLTPTQGASKANSGIIHAGYDDAPQLLRGRMVVRGNALYDQWHEEIGFRFKRNGSLVVAFDQEQVKTLHELLENGKNKGIPGLEIWGQEELRKNEPNLNKSAIAALYAPTAGVVCPMEVVNFLFKNAVVNGVTPLMGHEVLGFEKAGDRLTAVVTGKGKIHAKLVINASGVNGDIISAKAGIDKYKIIPRKGEYILLEPHEDYFVQRIIFPTPTKVSKGSLVTHTITGDILLGPTAVNLDDSHRENTFTTKEGLAEVLKKCKHLVPTLSTELTVKTFAGIRAQPNTNDFIIEAYERPENLINVIGIRSPGLTSAPAIAEYVIEIIEKKMGTLEKRPDYNPLKRPHFKVMELAKQDPAWGKALTPHLDSPPLTLLDMTWDFGVQKELYNYTCFTDMGLGIDLASTFQNALISWLKARRLKTEEIIFRHPGSVQVFDETGDDQD